MGTPKRKEISMKFVSTIKKLVKDESGISAVEYALLLALIGAGIATAAYSLGGQVQTNIENATTALQQGAS
jgi:pilus assembly protein Flp/PilA